MNLGRKLSQVRAQPAISSGSPIANPALDVRSVGRLAATLHVRTYDSFDDLPGSYGKLLSTMGSISFSFSREWFLTFADTALQTGARLRLYGVESGTAPGGARALLVAQTPAARRGSVLRRRYIGRRTLSGLTGYQTYLYALLVRDGDPHYGEIFACLARYLRNERPRWQLLDFSAMERDAPSYGALLSALRQAGYVTSEYAHFLGMYQPTQGQDYGAYLAARPASERRQIKNYERKERKLRDSGSLEWRLFTAEAGLEGAIRDYASVQDASWKEPDHHPEFLPACIRAAARASALRLGILYLDGQPAATQLVFLAGRRAVFYRTAYDPAFAKHSAGAIVKRCMVEHLLDQERTVDEFDFGRDRESFKKIWASHERTRQGILAFDCRTPGGWRALGEHALFQCKERIGEATRPLRNSLAQVRQRPR